MQKIILLLLTICLISCQNKETTNYPVEIQPTFENFNINSSIRALAAVDSETAWFAGSGGKWGFTEDGGTTWTIDSIQHQGKYPAFRSLVVNGDAVLVLSVASPALLYKTMDKGKNWKLVYQEEDTLAFYNSMTFVNKQIGFAVGDPQDGCLSLLKTTDGGDNWTKIDCDKLPATVEGEAGFAASNTNVITQGKNVWLVSGGKKARVFHSTDLGETWNVYETPIVQGGQMTGIFSAAFYDENNGVIWGGDWEQKEQNTQNKAKTTDSGKTWKLISDGKAPGYQSCIQYLPNSNAKAMISVGSPGINYSSDGGNSWQSVSDEGYYTIRIADEHTAWLAGNRRVGRMKF
jgi:photosystem II stability/assembly factor-like uncharacterized protein